MTAPLDPSILNRIPGPGSMTWENMGRLAMLSLGARALVLQTAHPIVGAGVQEHSDFRTDLLPRLARTLTSMQRIVYGTPTEALAEARRVRTLHHTIRGTDRHGRRYHALEPEAYAWVHATLFESVVTFGHVCGAPLTADAQARLYTEWRAVGRMLGLSEYDLPPTAESFRTYFDNTVANRLEVNPVVRDLLGPALLNVSPPAPIPAALWKAIWPPLGRRAVQLTISTLPPAYLQRLSISLTDRDKRSSRRFFACTAVVDRLLPDRYRYLPLAAAARRGAR
ncbi:oxygenase MpaB family protein [Streptomyces sp. R11]|uniref:Oxygenase MpaB family protein n=1 Tax=Streptomyces sp. R11 TaxID=3238625 RepID=A0AB39NDS4_9ACTN